MNDYVIYTDGGGRGDIGSVFVCNGKVLKERTKYRKVSSNNEAEYVALIDALSFFQTKYIDECDRLTVKSDSKLMVNQITEKANGEPIFQTKSEGLLKLRYKVMHLLENITKKLGEKPIIRWVPRKYNWAGRMLESNKNGKRF